MLKDKFCVSVLVKQYPAADKSYLPGNEIRYQLGMTKEMIFPEIMEHKETWINVCKCGQAVQYCSIN